MLLPSAAAFTTTSSSSTCTLSTLPSSTLVSAPPTGSKGPDDITFLAVQCLNNAAPLIWTAYQNGINANGTPGTPGGPTQSTIVGYDPSTGTLIQTIKVTGKVDGLTADSFNGTLIATVNEDANSSFNVIDPATGTVTTYTYSPSPEVSGAGGTDSIAVDGWNNIYVAHSNPNDTSQPTDYRVSLDQSTHTASLTPVFFNNGAATNALNGAQATLGLTDPDTNYFMPLISSRFGGDLATISQGDGEIIFASNLGGTPQLEVINLTDNKPGNVPPIDGIAVATSSLGTLYVVDNKAGTITALNTDGCSVGTVFVGEPNDNMNPLVGTLNLWTGAITPFGNTFGSPKGLLFVPAASQSNIYLVAPGDTVQSIAWRNGITVSQLLALNPQIPTTSSGYYTQDFQIFAGEPIKVVGTTNIYMALPGDSVSSIAWAHGMTTWQLLALNPQIPPAGLGSTYYCQAHEIFVGEPIRLS